MSHPSQASDETLPEVWHPVANLLHGIHAFVGVAASVLARDGSRKCSRVWEKVIRGDGVHLLDASDDKILDVWYPRCESPLWTWRVRSCGDIDPCPCCLSFMTIFKLFHPFTAAAGVKCCREPGYVSEIIAARQLKELTLTQLLQPGFAIWMFTGYEKSGFGQKSSATKV